MGKIFNVNGACVPRFHYMVDLHSRLEEIGKMIAAGQYFTINKARQFRKTTILQALADYLKDDYVVLSLDFQRLSYADFAEEAAFVSGMAREVYRRIRRMEHIPDKIIKKMYYLLKKDTTDVRLAELFDCFNEWCELSDKPIVMLIDEVDTATNNQVFLDFLAQLRAGYLDRYETITFQSVILAGVYDVRNIRRKLRPDEEHRQNSPWNIAADFEVNMSFNSKDIEGMLRDYEADRNTGMDISKISGLIHEYTSGYPFLVSRICKIMDEELPEAGNFSGVSEIWTEEGVVEAVKRLLSEKNTLFESLIGKLNDYPELKKMIYLLLFQGRTIAYNADDHETDMLLMFGFIKVDHAAVQIANRIFETRLYNYFLTLPEVQNGEMYRLALCNNTKPGIRSVQI